MEPKTLHPSHKVKVTKSRFAKKRGIAHAKFGGLENKLYLCTVIRKKEVCKTTDKPHSNWDRSP